MIIRLVVGTIFQLLYIKAPDIPNIARPIMTGVKFKGIIWMLGPIKKNETETPKVPKIIDM